MVQSAGECADELRWYEDYKCTDSGTCTTAGLLCLLDEPESSLQSYALEQINSLIDTFWAEVADHVVKM